MKRSISMVCIFVLLICMVITSVSVAVDDTKFVIFSPDMALKALKDNAIVRKWEKGADISPMSTTKLGFDESVVEENVGSGSITKVSVNGNPGIKFEISGGESGSLVKKGIRNNAKGLFVTSFTLNTNALGKQVVDFKLDEVKKLPGTSTIDKCDLASLMKKTPTLTFYNGNIYLDGTREHNNSTSINSKNIIGEYPVNENFDVDYVLKQPSVDDKAVYIEGIYINGLKIFPTGQEVNNYNAFYDTESGYYTLALVKTSSKTVTTAAEVEEKAEYSFQYAGFDQLYLTNSVANQTDLNKGVKSIATFSNISVYGTDSYVYENESGMEDSALSLTSEDYTVIESDAIMGSIPTIKGVVDKTAAELLVDLSSSINTNIDIYCIDGTTKAIDDMLVTDGMKVCVSDNAKSKSKFYTVSNAFDPGIINVSIDAMTIKSSRNAYKYNTDTEDFIYVTAVYDSDNLLKCISIDEKRGISTAGSLNFCADITNITLESGEYVKVFLWKYDSLTPMTGAYKYFPNGTGSYEGAVPGTNLIN